MKRGFGFIEVMVALVIMALIMTAVTRLYIFSTRTNAYADNLTYAAALGHSRLQTLKSMGYDAPELGAGWHGASDNPILASGRPFYLAWSVIAQGQGKVITVYTAWDAQAAAQTFSSVDSLTASGCAYTQCRGYVGP